MATIRKFLFDTDFDPDRPRSEEPAGVAPPVEPAPASPVIGEAELAAAREAAFAAGREAGLAEGRETAEAQAAVALHGIAERLAELFRRQEEANAATARDAVAVALAAARKLFPDLNRRNALGEVERLVETTLDKLMDEPRVVIRVGATLRDPLEARIGPLIAGTAYAGKVTILADDSLPLGDCRLEWADGGAERSVERLMREIDEVIERNFAEADAAMRD
jgi:flagellar assembly protein FliH